MYSWISRRVFIVWCVVVLSGLCFPEMLFAEPDITTDREDLDFFELHCSIMEVHRAGNYLVAGEERVELIDLRKGKRRFRTMLRDSGGNTIPLSFFKKGQMVFIRGFKLSDGRIKAREIYRLPRKVITRSALRKYPFFKKVPVWEPTIVK